MVKGDVNFRNLASIEGCIQSGSEGRGTASHLILINSKGLCLKSKKITIIGSGTRGIITRFHPFQAPFPVSLISYRASLCFQNSIE